MKDVPPRTPVFVLVPGFLIALFAGVTFSQSQALNGQIEGTVIDQNENVIATATIKVRNNETGTVRVAEADANGLYRFPLLPLGAYSVAVEAPNFKKLIRNGITLSAGQNVVVDLMLEPGVDEVVNVHLDASVIDAGKTELSRVMNTREALNLPLITRNPLNLIGLQANVNGRPGRGPAFANYNINGYLRRINYLIDGNLNTAGDTPNRLMAVSDVYVSEIQLVTNGFAAEFGNTPGMIVNVVTPAGTNNLHGAATYRFRVPSFYTRPFGFPAADVPDNYSNNVTFTIGGPIQEDRWHFYFGTEFIKRDDKATSQRIITITPQNRRDLIAAGLSPSIFPPAIPAREEGHYYIFRTDVQWNDNNRLMLRFNNNDGWARNFSLGGLNTLERASNGSGVDYALAAQLASYSPGILNEFRFQYAQRGESIGCRSEDSGTGPSINIVGVANFGSPACTDQIPPPLGATQFQDNLTHLTGSHDLKFGGGLTYYDHAIRAPIVSSYTFDNIEKYIEAVRGIDRKSYSSYGETFGDPALSYQATFWSVFAQDDWRVTRRLKVNYGLRYDLYLIPKADPNSPLPASRTFQIDKNNISPRLGLAYTFGRDTRPTILRLGAGFYYDAPQFRMYSRALQNNGDGRLVRINLPSSSLGAPDFPNAFSGTLPPQSIDAVAPDFENMYAIHSNIQLEQAITENISFAVGYVHSGGRHIPVYRNSNCLPVGATLADGRPLFGEPTLPIVPCTNRINIEFQNILMVESVGSSRYDALNLQLTKRYSRGIQFSAHYTLAKAIDDAPEQLVVTPGITGLVASDPTNRGRDRGRSFADQRHTFVMSLIAQPTFDVTNRTLRYLLNNNQIGMLATANSGETFNIVSNIDLNRDGIFSGVTNADRPVGIPRNAGTTPPQYNVDLRWTRFISISERYKLDVFAEFQNLFNINCIVQYNNVLVNTNPVTGELTGPLPDFKTNATYQESRQVQIGVRFSF